VGTDRPIVAIAGGGASGILVASQLLRQALEPVEILLFDSSEQLGGLAYLHARPEHLLNVPAGRMSALPSQPNHFLEWLNHPSRLQGAAEVSPLEESFRIAKPGCSFRHLCARVEQYIPAEHAGTLVDHRGDHWAVHFLVLALGNLPSRDPLHSHHAFFQQPRYIKNVWAPGALDRIAPEDDVLLIGSGLTAVDAAISLDSRGHRGRIQVTSRGGLLPQPHAPSQIYPDFLAKHPLPSTAIAAFRRVRSEATQASATGIPWQSVIDALRPHTSRIWQGWNLRERRRFLRHNRALWETHRHRMPPQSAQTIQRLRDSGQFELIPGRIRDFRDAGSGAIETVLHSRGGTPRKLTSDWVINCIGPDSNFRQHFNDPLILHLIDQALIHPDPLFLGLEATAEGYATGFNGEVSKNIALLGPPLRGTLWESTAIPEIRLQAETLARRILRHVHLFDWSI
jgi:uncharacterized NAD(P)/FAD-binding protein YdhS